MGKGLAPVGRARRRHFAPPVFVLSRVCCNRPRLPCPPRPCSTVSRYFVAFQAMDFLLLKKMKARSWYSRQVIYYVSSVCGLWHLLPRKAFAYTGALPGLTGPPCGCVQRCALDTRPYVRATGAGVCLLRLCAFPPAALASCSRSPHAICPRLDSPKERDFICQVFSLSS